MTKRTVADFLPLHMTQAAPRTALTQGASAARYSSSTRAPTTKLVRLDDVDDEYDAQAAWEAEERNKGDEETDEEEMTELDGNGKARQSTKRARAEQRDKFGFAGMLMRDLALFTSIGVSLIVVALALLSLIGGYDFVPVDLFFRFSTVPLLFLLLQPFVAIPLMVVRGLAWPIIFLVYAILCATLAAIVFAAGVMQAIRIIDGTEMATTVQQFGIWIALFGGAATLFLQLVLVAILAVLITQTAPPCKYPPRRSSFISA